MGIERARVVEVYAGDAASGRAGSGYQVDGRLVLTSAGVAGRSVEVEVRPAGTGAWVPASVVWRGGGAAVIEVSDPSVLMASPGAIRWGEVVGRRPVAVTGMGFPSSAGRAKWARDPQQFVGHLSGDGSVHTGADGMAGAAVFAGAELVGVMGDGSRAVAAASLAADQAFVELVGGVSLVPVEARAVGFPMLR